MSNVIHSQRSRNAALYVSPTGGGSGFNANSPMHFKKALDRFRQNITFYFLPGTYDFGNDAPYVLRDCYIMAQDPNNRPVFTRSAAMPNPITSYLFSFHGDCVISNVVFDKWASGNGNTNTDVPSCARVSDPNQGASLRLSGAIDVRASKFDYNGDFHCFLANQGSHLILSFATNSNGEFTFDGLAASNSDSGNGVFSVFAARTSSVVRLATDDTHTMEIKAGHLGKNLRVFDNLRDRNYGSLYLTFDSCQQIVNSGHGLNNLTVYLKQQGYNSDGTVNNGAVGGTDYKVHDVGFIFSHCQGAFTSILQSDIYCERGFVKAMNGMMLTNISAGVSYEISSTPTGDGIDETAAIQYSYCTGRVYLGGKVEVNMSPNRKFDFGLNASDSCCVELVGDASQPRMPISGRAAAARFSNVARGVVDHIEVGYAGDGVLVESTGSRVFVQDTTVAGNDVGIHVNTSSDAVIASNVSFAGNSSNYGSANVLSAEARVYTISAGGGGF